MNVSAVSRAWLAAGLILLALLVPSSHSAQENQIPENLLAACDKALADENYDQALVCYEKRIELEPNNAWAFRGVSNVFLAREAVSEGKAWFDCYLAAHPSSALALYGRANVLRDQDPKGALTDIEAALATDEKIALAWNLKGIVLRSLGVLDGSLAAIDKAIELDPSCLMFFNNLATTITAMGREKELVERWEKTPDVQKNIKEGLAQTIYQLILPRLAPGAKALAAGEAEQANSLFTAAITWAQGIGVEGTTLSKIQSSIGDAFYEKGFFRLSLSYYEKALEIDRRLGDVKGEGSDLTNLGVVYKNLGDYPRAISYYEQALAIDRRIEDVGAEGDILNALGSCYWEICDYSRALSYFEKALLIARRLEDAASEESALTGFGLVYTAFGDYSQALISYKKSLAIARRIHDASGEGIILTDIGVVFYNLGDYSRAMSYYNEALAIARRIEDKKTESANLNNLGRVFRILGDYSRAVSYYEQALAIDRQIGYAKGQGIMLDNLGDVYCDLGDYWKALSCLEQALAIAHRVGYVRGERIDLTSLGVVHSRLSHYSLAILDYEQALEIARRIGDAKGEGECLGRLGVVQGELGNYSAALSYFEQAVKIAFRIGDVDTEYLCFSNQGRTLVSYGQFAEAASSYEAALAAIERISGKLTGEQKAGYLEKVRWVYEEYIEVLRKLHQTDPSAGHDRNAFQVAERGKAQDLKEQLAERRAGLLAQADPELAQKELNLRAQIKAKQKLMADSRTPPEAQEKYRQEMRDLEGQLQATIVELRKKNPIVAEIVYPQAPSVEDGRRKVLGPDEALLEYVTGHNDSYVLIVTKDKYALIALGATEAELQDLVYGMTEKDKPRGPGLRDGLTRPVTLNSDRAKDLYRRLLGDPLKSQPGLLNGINRVVVVPHGPLYGLPFEVLHDGQGYLGDRFEIRYGPSALILRMASESKSEGKSLLSVANPDFGLLPVGATCAQMKMQSMALEDSGSLCPLYKIEATGKNLQKNGGTGSQFLTGKNATKSAFVTQAPGKRDIFVGTHGLLDGAHPMYSMLAFAPGRGANGDDGRLHAYEVFGLNLKGVDLVSLAACQTGEGKPIGGSLQGLSSAFLAAGAKGLVVSLWSVDEQATAKLMELFYARLNKGMPAARALAEAKRELRKITVPVDPHDPGKGTISYDQPYYWAGFILIGK